MELVEQICPLCGQAQHRGVCQVVDSTYGIPGVFEMVRCASCQHVFLNPRPSDSCLMKCYPTNYAPHEDSQRMKAAPEVDSESDVEGPSSERVGGHSESIQQPSRFRRVLRSIPGLRAFAYWLGEEDATWLPQPPHAGVSRLLEIGCANGSFLTRAADVGWVVDGVEPSQAAAEIARAKGLDVYCGHLTDAHIGSEQRDWVALWMVLEHVPNPVETIDEIFRILRPGGGLALSVPNAATWERWVFGRYWLGYDAPRHLQVFTATSLSQLLTNHGFEEVRVIHQANARYWWGSMAAWAQAKFPHRRWPQRWMDYFRTEPPAVWKWFLLVPAKIVAMLRCSGRITVIARKRV